MAEKMLIDASHEEETRVVVVRGNRIEEFDFESQHKKQLRGNIYLAKVTRVEPSLQAAFVDYGGNRHGFLAFSEIHPDYYQIPLADRQALLQAEAEAQQAEADSDNQDEPGDSNASSDAGDGDGKPAKKSRSRRGRSKSSRKPKSDANADADAAQAVESGTDDSDAQADQKVAPDEQAPAETAVEAVEGSHSAPAREQTKDETPSDGGDNTADDDTNKPGGGEMHAAIEADDVSETVEAEFLKNRNTDDDSDDDDDDNGNGNDENGGKVESVGAEDALEELPGRQQRVMRKQYRIQEVIKRRQILLVQVVKEERGNKGAALTTYLSLAGRYSVLMPNTARGGGISRKITNLQDRKRLKEIARELEVPQGMGVILRTAGANRTKAEIKRDFEYLMRLWENVRTLTLNSTAPTLVYEEGSLIKRSIRDLYNKDISEVVVSGEEGYREAKDFMKMLMPSHAKVVQPYRDIHPIFARSGIEAQLDRMLQPQVTLKSGGYIIINQTEALVAIDVNSGRSTREHSIEDTALQTNLEAADEVARQLRLRDLAGLIVIDFIDMEEKRNNRSVEKKVKECLKNDRARIQVGRISHFGLLEMSRQRIRASVLESTTQVCDACGGTGHVRSKSSIALHVLRGIEEYLLKNTTHDVQVATTPEIALYLLNQKRGSIVDLEARFGLSIEIASDAHVGAQHFSITRGEPVESPVAIDQIIQPDTVFEDDDDDDVAVPVEEDEAEQEKTARQDDDEGSGRNKRRRRRRRRGGRDNDDDRQSASSDDSDDNSDDDSSDEAEASSGANDGDGDGDDQPRRKKRRRGKRGGRRNRGADGDGDENQTEAASNGKSADNSGDGNGKSDESSTKDDDSSNDDANAKAAEPAKAETAEPVNAEPAQSVTAEQPAEAEKPAEQPEHAEAAASSEATDEAKEAPKKRRSRSTKIAGEAVVTSSAEKAEDEKPKKAGWWQRRGFF